jgi:predicted helicase
MSKPKPSPPSNGGDKWARPHQREAIDDCIKGFKQHDRGQCIMACGTGKTRVALRVAEKLGAQLTLIAVPSIALIAQVIREWRDNYNGSLSILAVCSDYTTSAEGEDQVRMTATELREATGVTVTTVATDVTAFMCQNGNRVVISTYQSSEVVATAQRRAQTPAFDFAIADEAHRTAGNLNGSFATIVRGDAIIARKRLFMTATPRIFAAQRGADRGFETVQVSSMDDIELYGPVFHRLGFMEAVERGLLADWKAVITVVYVDEVTKMIREQQHVKIGKNRVTARDLAMHITLNKAVIAHRLRKIITFNSRVSKANEFSINHNIVNLMLPKKMKIKKQWIKHVSAYQPSNERLTITNEFASLGPEWVAVLTNAQCLTEGVDIPSVDAVMFCEPKHSVTAIVQAVGRCMRISPSKTLGLIVIPVFLDRGNVRHTHDQQVWDDALETTEFRTMRNVLIALRTNDESFGGVMTRVQRRSIRNDGSRVVSVEESEPGIRNGTMIEAPEEETIVTTVKNGKAYNADGKEVVVTLPKNISIIGLAGGKTKIGDIGKSFGRAIVNRTVRWTSDTEVVHAEELSQFLKTKKRDPSGNSKDPNERRLAAIMSNFRAKYWKKKGANSWYQIKQKKS